MSPLTTHRVNKGLLQFRYLGGKEIKTKTLLTGIKSPKSFQALDAVATLELHADDPNFKAELMNACQQFRQDDPDHYTAAKAAQQALTNCNCESGGHL